jgi:hypothetical protein
LRAFYALHCDDKLHKRWSCIADLLALAKLLHTRSDERTRVSSDEALVKAEEVADTSSSSNVNGSSGDRQHECSCNSSYCICRPVYNSNTGDANLAQLKAVLF